MNRLNKKIERYEYSFHFSERLNDIVWMYDDLENTLKWQSIADAIRYVGMKRRCRFNDRRQWLIDNKKEVDYERREMSKAINSILGKDITNWD